MRIGRTLFVAAAFLVAPGCGGDDDDDSGEIDASLPPDARALGCVSTSSGCECDIYYTNELTECSAASVASGLTDGFCCEDAVGCDCTEVRCGSFGAYYCTCGPAGIITSGTTVSSCVSTSGVCCLDETLGWCSCNEDSCGVGETQVSICTPSSVELCDDWQTQTYVCR